MNNEKKEGNPRKIHIKITQFWVAAGVACVNHDIDALRRNFFALRHNLTKLAREEAQVGMIVDDFSEPEGILHDNLPVIE
jgi:hypothetical protein